MVARPNRDQIIAAFEQFERFGMPEGYGPPSRYYVADPRNGRLYPQKAIYGLALQLEQELCPNATQTRLALGAAGFEIVDVKEAESARESFDGRVAESLARSAKERAERLKVASRKPEKTLATVVRYQRNPDVVAERLIIANGTCEGCGKPAPFIRKANGAPYLEVHHVIPLSDEGEDTVENTRALCPNCHREAHLG